jgi:hypothetical protein
VAWVWNGGLEKNTTNAFAHHFMLAEIIARKARIASFKEKGMPRVPQGDVRALGRYTVKELEKGFRIWPVDLTKSKLWNLPKSKSGVSP